MKIRSKLFFAALPVVVASLFLAETASYFAAVNGVTKVAQSFLGFKAGELKKYAESQWNLLLENDYASRPDLVAAARSALQSYAAGLVLSGTEIIFAVDNDGALAMSTAPLALDAADSAALLRLLREESDGMAPLTFAGKPRVLRAFYFTPFQWYVVVSEEEAAFYQDARRIGIQMIITLAAAVLASALLLFLFSRKITGPLARVAAAMRRIIEGDDLSGRVEVEYRDETGALARTFNVMLGELEKAYGAVKRFAFDAVVAGKKEQRIRGIFQKYVPADVIDESFKNPGRMLPGKNADMAVLFSDIRSFTTISEAIGDPKDLVESLNRYFSTQVDIIYKRGGVVDKYIGDAIMAFWGAPVKHGDEALQAVLTGLDMLDALNAFNETQRRIGKPEFRIGVGINYGTVTVGNIGSERKRDYTVIGDMVNLASRMEGLTKVYHSELLVTETVRGQLREVPAGSPKLYFRHIDNVKVKGKKIGVKMYAVKKDIGAVEERAWKLHNEAMALYFPRRDFAAAAAKFHEAAKLLPGDFDGPLLARRCGRFAKAPPPEDWDGAEVMKSK
ncbi:MAG: adenylate/guanylate cyclase domain-containing protein [Treponema sp.]|jgi:class 3 adenylate cyclase/HAMP domain-containing protein|nr:adenylate/guanylate cyclase domain-containing protein [Treponema sp.]